MKTLGILIGAALVLATAHDARATGTGGFKTTCPGIADMLQMDFESCQFNAKQKTGAERQKHWKWCKFQHKNAADFIRLCHKFSGQCYQGRVNWSFTFYDFLPERPYDPPGIPASFPGSATTAYGGMKCGEAPDDWLPPGEAREAREREEREREEREAREREEREAREREAAETPDTAPGTEGQEAREQEAAKTPEPKCVKGMDMHSGCWQQLSTGRGCRLTTDASMTWSGSCPGGFATGAGTLVYGGSYKITGTGTYVDGKRHGIWIYRFPNGTVLEGLFVNGELKGEPRQVVGGS